MNDKFTLIAAATGGLMLSFALSGILKGTPVTNMQSFNMSPSQITHVKIIRNS